jgi:uncharacterized Zn-binding protein involved in type VI secretion
VLSYADKAGRTGIRNGRMEILTADACRIHGDSIHFVCEPGSDRVAFNWPPATRTGQPVTRTPVTAHRLAISVASDTV